MGSDSKHFSLWNILLKKIRNHPTNPAKLGILLFQAEDVLVNLSTLVEQCCDPYTQFDVGVHSKRNVNFTPIGDRLKEALNLPNAQFISLKQDVPKGYKKLFEPQQLEHEDDHRPSEPVPQHENVKEESIQQSPPEPIKREPIDFESANTDNFHKLLEVDVKEEDGVDDDNKSDEDYAPEFDDAKPVKRGRGRPSKNLNGPVRLYSCKACNGVFQSNKLLLEHKSQTESCRSWYKSPDLECSFCGATFKAANKGKYDVHMQGHLDSDKPTGIPVDQKTKCIKCKIPIENFEALKEHVRTFHSIKLSVCKMCHILVDHIYLRRHVRIHHFKERSHTCKDCGEVIVKWTRHKACPFKRPVCEECGQTFHCNSYLQQHIIAVHKNLRIYVCDQCGKKFKQENNLKTHKRIHGEMMFECRLCKHQCYQKYNLIGHIMRIHKIKKEEANSAITNLRERLISD